MPNMDDRMEQINKFLKRNGTSFDPSEFRFRPNPYEIQDSPVTIPSWNFLEHENDSYNTPSGTDGSHTNWWFVLVVAIIAILIRYFCIIVVRSWCTQYIWAPCCLSGSDTSRLVDSMESASIPTTQARSEVNTEHTITTASAGNNLSLNNIRVDQYAINSGGVEHNRSMIDAEFLPDDKPPAYSTAVNGDLSGDTFPSVSIRDSTQSPPPGYEERSIRNS